MRGLGEGNVYMSLQAANVINVYMDCLNGRNLFREPYHESLKVSLVEFGGVAPPEWLNGDAGPMGKEPT
jgi:hypothetical protein